MNRIIFILLTTFLSGLLAGGISAIISFLYSLNHADHPHQIFPTWMIMFILSFIVAGIVGGLSASFFVLYKQEIDYSLSKLVLRSSAIGLGIIGLMTLYFKFFA